MPVARDASSIAQTFSGVSSKNWNHTAAGSNRAVYVIVTWIGFPTSGATVTGVTYGGVAMTSLAKETHPGRPQYIEIFELKNPATGSQAVVVSFSDLCYGVTGSISYTGVDQTTASGTPAEAIGNTTAPTITVASTTAGNMVVGGFASDFGNYAVTPNDTNAWSGQERPGTGYYGAAQDAAAGGSITLDWTIGTAKPWAALAVEILASAGGVAADPTGWQTSAPETYRKTSLGRRDFVDRPFGLATAPPPYVPMDWSVHQTRFRRRPAAADSSLVILTPRPPVRVSGWEIAAPTPTRRGRVQVGSAPVYVLPTVPAGWEIGETPVFRSNRPVTDDSPVFYVPAVAGAAVEGWQAIDTIIRRRMWRDAGSSVTAIAPVVLLGGGSPIFRSGILRGRIVGRGFVV